MKEDELHSRALKLERQLRRFIVTTNAGSIDGGFGSLDKLNPPAEDIHERIGNIEQSMAGFGLVGGDGLMASGTLKEGYKIEQA